MISDLHFIRPLWLLALLPLALLWLLLRRRADAAEPWRNIIAPHLLPHLLSIPGSANSALLSRPPATRAPGQDSPSASLQDIASGDAISALPRSVRIPHSAFQINLLALAWLVAVVAIAGPTWRHEPAPFADDTAALAIVIRVSPAMLTEDVQPSRLARATEKIHDLLALRPGAKTILIAYAGTAHTVMPATTDAGIINIFAQALSPKIMPRPDGDDAPRALRLASQALDAAGGGSILWITDSLSPALSDALSDWRKTTRAPVYLYPPLPAGGERDALTTAARPAHARNITLTPDDADVRSLASAAKFVTTPGDDKTTRWAETGYWLTPLLALLLLPFFRRGWMLSTAARSQ